MNASQHVLAVAEYYEKSFRTYDRIWGPDPHFGLFGTIAGGVGYSLEKASEIYTDRLVSMGLAAIPMHWRKSIDRLRILDLCCGKGNIGTCLLRRDITADYTGVDICRLHVDAAREQIRPLRGNTCKLVSQVIHSSIEEFFENYASDQAFDLVFCQDSFYHVEHKESVLKNVFKILRAGGAFILSDLSVDQHWKLSNEFKEYFIDRQANSEPLTFSAGARAEPIYKEEELLRNSGFFISVREDKTSDLEQSYSASLAEFSKIPASRLIPAGQLPSWHAAFEFLRAAAHRREFRLIWWVAIKHHVEKEAQSNTTRKEIARLEVKKPGFRYPDQPGGLPLLDQLELQILRGDYIGLIGKTGSGKSTLLNALMGYLPSKTVISRRLENIRVGMVAQDPVMFTSLTVQQHLDMALRLNRKPAKINQNNESLRSILADSNLEQLASQPVESLSRGQRQRAAIAMVVAAGPDLLLLDEPLASQDAIERENLIRMLEAFRRENANLAMIHISHVWQDLKGVQRLYEISSGQLIPVPKPVCRLLVEG